jgi:hypothetical protein
MTVMPSVGSAVSYFSELCTWDPVAGQFTLAPSPGLPGSDITRDAPYAEVLTWWEVQAQARNATGPEEAAEVVPHIGTITAAVESLKASAPAP